MIGVRFNPGKGSGGTGKTNVGGPSASFGIWHELLPQVKDVVAKYNIQVERIHTHIGSGSDPAVWQSVAGMSLALVKEFPDVEFTIHILNFANHIPCPGSDGIKPWRGVQGGTDELRI